MKIIIIIVCLFPLWVLAQLPQNILRNSADKQGMSINHVVYTNDSAVFTGFVYKYDSAISQYYTDCFIAKTTLNGAAFKAVPLFSRLPTQEIIPFKMYATQTGFMVFAKYYRISQLVHKEIGVLCMAINADLTLADTSETVLYTTIDTDTNTRMPEMYCHVAVAENGNYILATMNNLIDDGDTIINHLLKLDSAGNLLLKKRIPYNVYISSATNVQTPISTIETLQVNDTLRYVAYSGSDYGGITILDTQLNIISFKRDYKINPFAGLFQNNIVYSTKFGDDMLVVGVADSFYLNSEGNAYIGDSRLLLKRVRNGKASQIVWFINMDDRDVDNILYSKYNYQNIITVNEKKEILVTQIIPFGRVTYMVKLDSNLNIVWEKYLDSYSIFGSGVKGAIPIVNQNKSGYLVYGHGCPSCTMESNPLDIDGYMSYLSEDGAFTGGLTSAKLNNHEAVVFPNPFKDVLSINSIEAINQITIYNNQGKIVFNQTYNHILATTIPTSNIEQGFYVMRLLYINGTTQTQKLIK